MGAAAHHGALSLRTTAGDHDGAFIGLGDTAGPTASVRWESESVAHLPSLASAHRDTTGTSRSDSTARGDRTAAMSKRAGVNSAKRSTSYLASSGTFRRDIKR